MIILLLLAMGIAVYGLLMYGIVIFSFKETCKKESRNPYGKYSTGMYFAFKDFIIQKKGNGILVKGTYEGSVPPYSGLVHVYTNDGEDIAALVRKSTNGNGEAGLKLFLSKRVDINNISEITTARRNFRLKEDELPENVTFPVSIRKSLSEMAISIYMTAIGGFMMFGFVSTKGILLGIFALLSLVIGAIILADSLFTKCRMDNENFVIISDIKGKKEYPIRRIRISTATQRDDDRHFTLSIFDRKTNKLICSFQDRSKNYNEMLVALRTSIERALYEDIYLPYMDKLLYVHATPEGRIAIATNDDGDKGILAYETLDADINPVLEGYERKEMLLSEIVAECGNFKEVDRIVIRSSNGDYTDITKHRYETMLKYIV